MKMQAPTHINAKPWLGPNAHAGSYALGMLGLEERKLLYHLTRYSYSGEGAVVELGAFCGASTCCLAAGLKDNPQAVGRRVHSYDALSRMNLTSSTSSERNLARLSSWGTPLAAIFRRETAQFAELIEVHAGDLLEQTWASRCRLKFFLSMWLKRLR